MKNMQWVKKDLVISRHADSQKTISLFGDDLWDLTPYKYQQRGSATIDFKDWNSILINQPKLKLDVKIVFYLLLNEPSRGYQSITTVTTICGAYKSLLRKIAIFCVDNTLQLSEFFNNPKAIIKLAKEFPNSTSSTLASLINKINGYGIEKIGFEVGNSEHLTSYLRQNKKKGKKDQAAYIPERILTAFIEQWSNDLDLFNINWVRLSKYLDFYYEFPGAGMTIDHQQDIYKYAKEELEPDFLELSKQFKLVDYFDRYKITDIKKISSHIVYMQCIGKCMIQFYSGMRHSEAMTMQSNSYQKIQNISGADRWILNGHTSKHKGKLVPAYWVTTKDLKPTWQALTSISEYITSWDDWGDVWPLFVSVSYLELVSGDRYQFKVKDRKRTTLDSIDPLRHLSSDITINKQDHDVMHVVDPHFDWSVGEYSIGSRWSFKSHQLRRTVALLAIQSGSVSLPSLKRQFKHLIEELTYYYCSGVAGLGVESTFGHEFVDMYRESVSQVSSYQFLIDVVLNSNDVETAINKMGADSENSGNTPIVIIQDRTELLKLAERGELSSRDTVLGVCFKSGSCFERAHVSLLSCTTCPHAGIRIDRVDRAIKVQGNFVLTLPKESVEYRSEKRKLDDLKAYRKKAEK